MVAGVCLFLAVLVGRWSFGRGVVEGELRAEARMSKAGSKLPAGSEEKLNEALFDLRKGNTNLALKSLRELEESPSDYASLSYLVALAAMQNGDIPLAEQKVRESLAKRERISDSLALQSVLETQKASDPSLTTMGDPSIRSEALLRQAIIADAANPYPHFELATLLRYKGRHEEALAEIRAAQARLNPLDSHLVMDVTTALMRIEQTPLESLDGKTPLNDDVRQLFPAAFAAMRRGDFPQAVSALQRCRELLPTDVFDYLIYDPALRPFSNRAELAPFFQ